MSIKYLAHFLIGLFVSLSFESSLHFLELNLLSDMWFGIIFSQSVACLFISWSAGFLIRFTAAVGVLNSATVFLTHHAPAMLALFQFLKKIKLFPSLGLTLSSLPGILFLTLLSSRSVMSDSLKAPGLQHSRPPVLHCLLEFAEAHVCILSNKSLPTPQILNLFSCFLLEILFF